MSVEGQLREHRETKAQALTPKQVAGQIRTLLSANGNDISDHEIAGIELMLMRWNPQA